MYRTTWCRIIGFEARSRWEWKRQGVSLACLPKPAMRQRALSPVRLDGIDPGAALDWGEQLAEGDLERAGVASELRRIMAEPLVVRWLGYLKGERLSKGRKLSDGTVRYYCGLVVNRLLQVLPARLSELTADELEDAYTQVVLSRSSPPQTARIQAALASFDRFVRERHLPELPRVRIADFEGGAYAISSRILVEAEYQAGLELIESGAIVLPDSTSTLELRAFWILAYRFGLRRSEILGLQKRDFAINTLTVRANAARSLKTVNARRVLPLSALPGGEQADIDLWLAAKAENTYCFFEHEPSARELESHPVVARAKELLGAVSGDRRLHVHNLRHSTATLHLLGALGSDLGLEHHPYAEPWMKQAMMQAMMQAGCVDAEISGAFYRRGGRGNALAMMMGHGSEATTYEHYAHSFDLLLFIACWSGRFRPESGRRLRGLYPPREERSLLLALMGLARTTRVETDHIPKLMARIVALAPDSVEVLSAREAPIEPAVTAQPVPGPQRLAGASNAQKVKAPLPQWRLVDWIELAKESSKTERGETGSGRAAALLALQSDRYSVAALWSRFKEALAAHPEELAGLLRVWMVAKGNGSDWASMAPPDAREWVRRLRMLMPDIAIEAYRAWKGEARRNMKSRVELLVRVDDVKEGHGRYYLRFADARAKRSHRSSASGYRRSRSQRSITWFVVALDERVGDMQAENLGAGKEVAQLGE